jgi:hypothetical protein
MHRKYVSASRQTWQRVINNAVLSLMLQGELKEEKTVFVFILVVPRVLWAEQGITLGSTRTVSIPPVRHFLHRPLFALSHHGSTRFYFLSLVFFLSFFIRIYSFIHSFVHSHITLYWTYYRLQPRAKTPQQCLSHPWTSTDCRWIVLFLRVDPSVTNCQRHNRSSSSLTITLSEHLSSPKYPYPRYKKQPLLPVSKARATIADRYFLTRLSRLLPRLISLEERPLEWIRTKHASCPFEHWQYES